MRRRDMEVFGEVMLSGVAVPPAGAKRPPHAPDDLVLGFDTEFIPATRTPLSVQLAARVGEKLFSTVFFPTCPGPAPRLTPAILLDIVRQFIAEHHLPVKPGRTGVKRVTLIAHFASAELGIFEDAFRDLHIFQIGKAHHAWTDVLDAPDGKWKIEIIDLFAFYRTSLREVGEKVGLPKLEVDIEHIEWVKNETPALFVEYAKRDAEIAILAYSKFRDELLRAWDVDLLFRPSLASVSATIFRHHFFRIAAAPYRTEVEYVQRRKRNGTWVPQARTFHVFAGDREVRRAAIECMHGGRAEAFARGLYVGTVHELDMRSQYPSAALAQPLPCANTRWRAVTSISEVLELEGVGRFEFAFPPDSLFPCLPVTESGRDGVLYPLRGVSDCTFSEVREALKMGAAVTIIAGYGFEPRRHEREHDLARFVRALMALKNAAPKGSVEYVVWKEILNSAVGKFAERVKGSNLLALERVARRGGLTGVAALVSQNPELRGSLRPDPAVGNLWAPEWSALVVGKARAWMAGLVAKGAHVVSTDAIIIPAGLDLDCPSLAELRGIGSDMPVEQVADALWTGRARQYAMLKRPANVLAQDEVFAVDSTWAVVRVAHQGSAETDSQFAETLLRCLAARTDVAPVRQRTRLLSAESAVKQRAAINSEQGMECRTRFNWDRKRRLTNRDVNPFVGFSATKPYETAARREGGDRARRVRAGENRRRPRVISESVRARVLSLLAEGRGLREVARAVRMAASTVAAIRDRGAEQK